MPIATDQAIVTPDDLEVTLTGDVTGTAALDLTTNKVTIPAVIGGEFKNLDTYTELRALPLTDTNPRELWGRSSIGDGGGGIFKWVSGDQSANITADPQSGVWVAPDADPTGASGAWQRVLDANELNPAFFGGPESQTANAAASVQAMFDFVRQTYNEGLNDFEYKCGLGDRTWRIETSINATNIRQPGLQVLNGNLFGTCVGGVVLDMLGSNTVSISNVHISSDYNAAPDAGFLYGRTDTGDIAPNFKFTDFSIDGSFAKACIVNLASEVSSEVNCRYINRYGGASRVAVKVDNAQSLTDYVGGVSSAYQAFPVGNHSNIQHYMAQVHIQAASRFNGAIASISQTNPAVVTMQTASTIATLTNGEKVFLPDIEGMTEVDKQAFTVANVDTVAGTFELSGVDATGYGAFTSGNLRAFTESPLVMSGAYDVSSVNGYILSYGTAPILIDAINSSAIRNLDIAFQPEQHNPTCVLVALPGSGGRSFRDFNVTLTSNEQEFQDSVLTVTGAATLTFQGFYLKVGNMPAAPTYKLVDTRISSQVFIQNGHLEAPLSTAMNNDTDFGAFDGKTIAYDRTDKTLHHDFNAFGDVKILNTDADGVVDPELRLIRQSASPAINDLLGSVNFEGRNDAVEDTLYARIRAAIADETDGTEDGRLDINLRNNGVEVVAAQLSNPQSNGQSILSVRNFREGTFGSNRLLVAADGTGPNGTGALVYIDNKSTPDTASRAMVYSVTNNGALAEIDTSADTSPKTVMGRNTAGDGGGGRWTWLSGNQSALVTSDPQQGLYIAPDSDATGASGVWARSVDGVFNAAWWGFLPSATAAANTTAFNAMIAYIIFEFDTFTNEDSCAFETNAGAYNVNALNMTQLRSRGFRWDSYGTRLICAQEDAVVVDLTHARDYTISNVMIEGDATNTPLRGWQIGYMQANASSGKCNFVRCYTRGHFKQAAFYNGGAEETVTENCNFRNANSATDGYAAIFDGFNKWGKFSDYLTPTNGDHIAAGVVSVSASATATVVTDTAHGFAVNDKVSFRDVTGTTNVDDFDEVWTVASVIDSTSFTVSGTNGNSGAGGFVWKVQAQSFINCSHVQTSFFKDSGGPSIWISANANMHDFKGYLFSGTTSHGVEIYFHQSIQQAQPHNVTFDMAMEGITNCFYLNVQGTEISEQAIGHFTYTDHKPQNSAAIFSTNATTTVFNFVDVEIDIANLTGASDALCDDVDRYRFQGSIATRDATGFTSMAIMDGSITVQDPQNADLPGGGYSVYSRKLNGADFDPAIHKGPMRFYGDASTVAAGAFTGLKEAQINNGVMTAESHNSGTATIADDAVHSFALSGAATLTLASAVATGINGVYFVDTAAPASAQLTSGGTPATVTTGVLAGTTGTDTEFTISAHTDGNVYLENRTGASVDVSWHIVKA